MKPPVPDAGRRRALGALGVGAVALVGCSVELRELGAPGADSLRTQTTGFLLPMATVNGGFTLAPAPVMGVWNPAPGPFLSLVGPVAAAARGADLYIADAGFGAVYHYDLLRQTLRRFLSTGAAPGARLCVLEDQTLLAFDPARRSLTRHSRDGVLLTRANPSQLPSGALDLALDEARGVVWMNDAVGGRLLALRPALNVSVPVPLELHAGEAIGQVTALAVGPDGLVVLDASRRRLVLLDEDGRVTQSFGESELELPRSVAVDRYRRVYAVDGVTLKVFFNGRLVTTITARELGAVEIRDLRIHDDDLAIADAAGARVHLFRVRPTEVAG